MFTPIVITVLTFSPPADCRIKADSCPAPDFDRAWEDEKKRKEEQYKNREETEREGADGNAVRIRRMNNPYQPNIWPKPKTPPKKS